MTVGLQRDVRPALAATDAIQCVTGGKAASGVKLTTHLQLTPKSIVCGVIPPLPHVSKCCSANVAVVLM